ncbi:hypothetical protein NPIL_478261 [Nephila pilipes]|uniref:Uncharacterized protein n=1 Tax=Nephila pilipes TaxID=299642 RepID=A0A8X6TLA0_NEPPI|nr:hypothetical protein NPIL_478261 [Nephila pilipes]
MGSPSHFPRFCYGLNMGHFLVSVPSPIFKKLRSRDLFDENVPLQIWDFPLPVMVCHPASLGSSVLSLRSLLGCMALNQSRF